MNEWMDGWMDGTVGWKDILYRHTYIRECFKTFEIVYIVSVRVFKCPFRFKFTDRGRVVSYGNYRSNRL